MDQGSQRNTGQAIAAALSHLDDDAKAAAIVAFVREALPDLADDLSNRIGRVPHELARGHWND